MHALAMARHSHAHFVGTFVGPGLPAFHPSAEPVDMLRLLRASDQAHASPELAAALEEARRCAAADGLGDAARQLGAALDTPAMHSLPGCFPHAQEAGCCAGCIRCWDTRRACHRLADCRPAAAHHCVCGAAAARATGRWVGHCQEVQAALRCAVLMIAAHAASNPSSEARVLIDCCRPREAHAGDAGAKALPLSVPGCEPHAGWVASPQPAAGLLIAAVTLPRRQCPYALTCAAPTRLRSPAFWPSEIERARDSLWTDLPLPAEPGMPQLHCRIAPLLHSLLIDHSRTFVEVRLRECG